MTFPKYFLNGAIGTQFLSLIFTNFPNPRFDGAKLLKISLHLVHIRVEIFAAAVALRHHTITAYY